jgi:1-acyl-sn-glycerol-3-phosphate acyltransferase
MLSHHATQILAGATLAGLGVALAATIGWWFRHPFYTPSQRICYFYGYVIARVLWRAEIRGRFPVPCDHGALIVCNHRSPYDPAFIQIAANRVVHWMVAREYCEHLAFRWFFRIVQSIPVSRGGIDTAATKMAIRYAEQGHLVGLFPEGRINSTPKLLLPGRPGAALIALKARVPVIPCYVGGAPSGSNLWTTMIAPARTVLTVGQPIDLTPFYGREKEREALEELTRMFLAEIAKLAGCAGFQPQLAGRHWKPEIS